MLSLSMIVRNEEARLAGCLESVRGFVDEMVVVDTGSNDGTIAIAEAAGARVEQIPWPGDFAPARNTALEFLTGDWVLVLDADEQLRSDSIPELKRLMSDPNALVINLLRFEVGATMAPYSSVSRLFRRHPRIRWSRPYHSMVDDSAQAIIHEEPHWTVAHCQEPALLHDGYRPELLQSSDKAQRLREAMESELERHPGDAYASAKLGGLLISEGRHRDAATLLGTALAQSSSHAPERYELLLRLSLAKHADEDFAVLQVAGHVDIGDAHHPLVNAFIADATNQQLAHFLADQSCDPFNATPLCHRLIMPSVLWTPWHAAPG